ncbi:MAG: hypothetical protein AAFR31_07160 [Cyanobacteria bacterium J06627_8]
MANAASTPQVRGGSDSLILVRMFLLQGLVLSAGLVIILMMI